MVMEYHLNQSTKMAYPAFYSFASDTFHIFNMLEMTGDTHYRYLTDCLYLYYGAGSNTAESTENTGKNCYTKHQKFDDFKSRIKTPLKMLDSLQGQGWAQQRDDYAVPDSTWETFKIVYQQYYQCVTHYYFVNASEPPSTNFAYYFVILLECSCLHFDKFIPFDSY